MDRVKFYSEYDMACVWGLNNIIAKINDNYIDTNWSISDLIEFHNILKYLNIKRFANYLELQTGFDSKEYDKEIKQKTGYFIALNKNKFLDLYDEIDFTDTEDFLEIIENYSIYKEICNVDFKTLLDKKYVHVYLVLKFRRLTEYFDFIVKEKIMSDCVNTETILSKYLDEANLYLPPSLIEEEILVLIDEYIDSREVNINILRKILVFPSGKGINIPDKIKLHAKRKEKNESEKIFNNGTSIESSVSISYLIDQDEAVQLNGNGTTVDIKVSRNWIEDNLDYLLNVKL